MPDPTQIADDLRGVFRGPLRFDPVARAVYSTDASPFQVAPLGVAVPADADDLTALVRYAHAHAVPLVPRGGGTGVAGESLGPGLVVDLSVNFRRIGEPAGDTITAGAGATLAAVNDALAQVGRRFAPDPASGQTCTVGGMVATNASGGNAFRYGYTRDHVAGLGVVWDDGETAAGDVRRAREVADLLTAYRGTIDATRPRTAYNRCGYVLHDVMTAAGPDLAKLLVGSEGTLGFVTDATLRTVPLPGGRAVCLLGFPTVDAAVRAGLDLRPHGPVSCDLLDRRLLSATRQGVPGPGMGLVPPAVGAALVVTTEADSEREAVAAAADMVAALRGRHVLRELAPPTCDPAAAARVRGVREAAVSGLYGIGRGPRPIALVEDVGVPADALPEFITGVQDALKRFELSASFLVHALTGQVHTRPLVDLDSPADRERLWPLAEAVHALALDLGGTVSTQHGTGIARTPWVEKQYGPLLPVFRELKRIFDPKHILNPGKIVGPDPSRPAWPLRPAAGWRGGGVVNPPPTTAETAATTPADDLPARAPERKPLLVWKGDELQEQAGRCNGCGDCRTRSPAARMCPVFRATGVEQAAPRAKANLARLLAGGAADLPDWSDDDVKDVADLCVNCKMCRDECAARVDVPKLMLEAKAAHQAEHGLDRADWVLARTEAFAALAGNFAPLANGLLARRTVRWLLEKALGLSQRRRLPAFTLRTFLRRARGRGLTRKSQAIMSQGRHVARPGLDATTLRLEDSKTRRIAYFVDTFANYADPLVGEATVAVLRHHGFEVYVPPRQTGSGAAPLSQGDVETARESAARNVRVLADLVREGYRVVCSEPTAALMLAQDYLDLLDDPDAAAVAANTVELTAFLGELRAAGRLRTDFRQPLDVTLGHHVPCHMKALRGPANGPGLLSLIPGVRVHTIDAGCSGMAGPWGLKAANYETSLAAGRPMLDELNRPRVLFGSTECGSCRMQMEEGSGKRTLHPVQYLAFAYGLLPEVGTKLRRPLRDLVSD